MIASAARDWDLGRGLRNSLGGVAIAMAITAVMDARGLSNFSALPLMPLTFLFWYLSRMSRQEMGFVRGQWRYYGLAVLHPLLVLSLVALIALVAGAIDISHTNWRKAWLNLALITVSTFLVAMVTEEGFFRGWLWAALKRAGWSESMVVISTSVAFSLWHLSGVTFKTGFDLPVAEIPVFLVNAAVIGVAWGLIRSISGSVVVTSVSHGLWNGIDYSAFGFGSKLGALGIKQTAFYGPEVGVLGLALNLIFVAVLWWWARARAMGHPAIVATSLS